MDLDNIQKNDSFLFKSLHLPDIISVDADRQKVKYVGDLLLQIKKRVAQDYKDINLKPEDFDVHILDNGRYVEHDSLAKTLKGRRLPLQLVFSKPEHLQGKKVVPGDHKPYQIFFNPLLTLYSLNDLPTQGEMTAEQMYEAINNLTPELIKEVIDHSQLLTEVCNGNQDYNQLWKKPQLFRQIMSLEGIKNAFNELALGKPLTKEQQKQRQDMRQQHKQQAQLAELPYLDFDQFPVYTQWKKKQMENGTWDQWEKPSNKPVTLQDYYQRGIQEQKAKGPEYAKKKQKRKDDRRAEIIEQAGLDEMDVDPPGYIDWRMHLINQAGERDPLIKYKDYYPELEKRGYKDEDQNTRGLIKAYVYKHTFERNLKNAIFRIHEFRWEREEWHRRQKLPKQEREALLKELREDGEPIYDFSEEAEQQAQKEKERRKKQLAEEKSQMAKQQAERAEKEAAERLKKEIVGEQIPKQEEMVAEQTPKQEEMKEKGEEKIDEQK